MNSTRPSSWASPSQPTAQQLPQHRQGVAVGPRPYGRRGQPLFHLGGQLPPGGGEVETLRRAAPARRSWSRRRPGRVGRCAAPPRYRRRGTSGRPSRPGRAGAPCARPEPGRDGRSRAGPVRRRAPPAPECAGGGRRHRPCATSSYTVDEDGLGGRLGAPAAWARARPASTSVTRHAVRARRTRGPRPGTAPRSPAR